MTRETIFGMLRQGNTGNEILSILDIISDGNDDTQSAQSVLAQPTSEFIEF
jgi:hypothetical protein